MNFKETAARMAGKAALQVDAIYDHKSAAKYAENALSINWITDGNFRLVGVKMVMLDEAGTLIVLNTKKREVIVRYWTANEKCRVGDTACDYINDVAGAFYERYA